jgi:hypothetical protein
MAVILARDHLYKRGLHSTAICTGNRRLANPSLGFFRGKGESTESSLTPTPLSITTHYFLACKKLAEILHANS